MKQLVKIARSVTIQNKIEVELDIPEEPVFYKEIEYNRIESIFAILPEIYKDNPIRNFRLIKVELYEQRFEDLSLRRDFNSTDFTKYYPLSEIALEIFEKKPFEYKQITKEEWIKLRSELLTIDRFL